MPLQKSLGAGSSQQLFMYLYMCVIYMSCKNPLKHISNGQLKELLHAPRGNYLKYLDYRCFYKNPLQTQQSAVSPTHPGLEKHLASGIWIYPQAVVGAAGHGAGEGDPDRALSSRSRTGLFTSSFGKI